MQLDALTEYWGLTPWAEQPDDVQDGVVADLYVTEDDSDWYWLYFVMKNYLTPIYESPISQTIVSYTVNDFSSNFQEYSVIQERLGLAKTAYLAEVAKFAPSGGGAVPDELLSWFNVGSHSLHIVYMDTVEDSITTPKNKTLNLSSVASRYNSAAAAFIVAYDSSRNTPSLSGYAYSYFSSDLPAFDYSGNYNSWQLLFFSDSSSVGYTSLISDETFSRGTQSVDNHVGWNYGFSSYSRLVSGGNPSLPLVIFKGRFAVDGNIYGSVSNPEPEPEPETPTDPAGPPAPPGYTRPTGGTTVVTGTTTNDGFDLDLTPVTDWLRTINENLTEFFGWYKDLADWLDEWFTTFIDQIRECCVGVRSLLEQILEVVRQIYYRIGFAGNPGHPDPVENPDEFANWFDKTVTDFVSKLPGTLQTALGRLQELTTRFPFSIPWDLMALFALFNHAPVTPVYDLNVPYIGGDTYTLHIDLSPYNDLAALARRAEVMLFTLALVLRTKWLTDALSSSTVKGGKDG